MQKNESIERLKKIEAVLLEIKQYSKEQVMTGSEEYKAAYNTDIDKLDALIAITKAIKSDVAASNISACTRLMIQNAPGDFTFKLARIPDRKHQIDKLLKRIMMVQRELCHE